MSEAAAAGVVEGRWDWLREPTKGQWLSFSAAWLGWVLDGFDFCIYVMVMPKIAKEFGLSQSEVSSALTATMLTRMVGGLLAGTAADRWGRRLPLMISIVWFALCNGAIGVFGSTWGAVLLLRALFGLGMGAEWTSGATLAMENWPSRSRGFASGVLQGSWGVGFILAAIAFGTLEPRFGWRSLFLVGAIPALLVLPIRIWVPESPEWLARRGVPKEERPKISLRGMVPSLVWGSIAMVLVFSGYYAVAGQYPSFLGKQLGMSSPEVMSHTILLNLGMLTGGALCGWMMMRFGLRTAMTAMMVGALLFVPFLVGIVPGWLLAGAYLGGTFGTGFTGVSPLLVTRLYPAHVRARAAGIVYHVGALGSSGVAWGVAALSEYAHRPLSWSIWVAAAAIEVAVIACFWMQPKAAQLDPGG